MISIVNQCFNAANLIYVFLLQRVHIGSELSLFINNASPAAMAIKSFTFPVAVVQDIIYQAIYCAAAIYNSMNMIQSTEAILDWSLLSLRNYCQ